MTTFQFNSKKTQQIKALYEKQSFLTAAGLFYGFPLCCIESFVQRRQLEVSERYPNAPYLGTGFMACECCAPKTQKNWTQFQAKINKARYCQTPFPQEGSHEALHNFYLDLILFFGDKPKEKILDLTHTKELMKTWRQRQAKKSQEKKLLNSPAFITAALKP